MTKLKKWSEFSARGMAWLGALCLETSTGWGMIKSSTCLGFKVSLGIVVFATLITSFLDMYRFAGRNKRNI